MQMSLVLLHKCESIDYHWKLLLSSFEIAFWYEYTFDYFLKASLSKFQLFMKMNKNLKWKILLSFQCTEEGFEKPTVLSQAMNLK